MARITLRAAACTIILSAWTLHPVFAQTQVPSASSVGAVSASMPGPPTSAAAADAPAGHASLDTIGEDGAPGRFPADVNARSVDPAGAHTYPHGYSFHAHRLPAPVYLPPNAPGVIPNGYPYLNAPLYSAPRQGVPYQVGATIITNQAFYPHEMLYAHKYKAMYPPYYYDVSGYWKVLPWGVCQSEQWRLRGTVVKVKYSSAISLTSGFIPPALRK